MDSHTMRPQCLLVGQARQFATREDFLTWSNIAGEPTRKHSTRSHYST